jgi:hypothetical protein
MGQLSPTNLMSANWLPTYEQGVLPVVGYAEIWTALDPFGLVAQTLLLGNIQYVGGSVTIDRNNVIRRTAVNVTLLIDAAGHLLPTANTTSGYLSPYGNELRLFKGCVTTGGGSGVPATATSTVTPPVLPLTVTLGVNDTFTFNPGYSTATTVFYVAPGVYTTVADVASAMDLAIDAYGNYIPQAIFDVGSLIRVESTNNELDNGSSYTSGPTDFLASAGFNSLTVLSGGINPTLTNEYAKLGKYLIEEVDVRDDGGGVTMVGILKDRGEWVSRRKFSIPYTTNGTSTVGDIINNILFYGAGLNYSGGLDWTEVGSAWSGGSLPCPYIPARATYNVGDDPWVAATDMAAHAGLQLYWDYDGNLTLEYTPDPKSIGACVAYLEYNTTAPVTISRAISNQAVPNVICVMSSGSSVTAPVQVWWWDSNSSSPTYYAPPPIGGFLPTNPQYALPIQSVLATYPFLIQIFQSTLIGATIQGQVAQAVAIAIGLTSIGSLEKTTFTIRDQPAHDVDDVIYFARVIAGIPYETAYIVDQVQIDLSVQVAEQLTTRLVYV